MTTLAIPPIGPRPAPPERSWRSGRLAPNSARDGARRPGFAGLWFRSGTRWSRVPSSAPPVEPVRLHTPCTPAATQAESKAELTQ